MATKKAKKGISLASSYKARKSVIQNIPMKDVDKLEGGFFPALLPFLPIIGALLKPLAERGVKWVGDKVFGKGILRAGEKRGSGIFQAGMVGRGYEPGDINLKVPQHTRKQRYVPGDMPMPTKYVIHGRGINPEKVKAKLMPFIKANDLDGFKAKIMKMAKKKAFI